MRKTCVRNQYTSYPLYTYRGYTLPKCAVHVKRRPQKPAMRFGNPPVGSVRAAVDPGLGPLHGSTCEPVYIETVNSPFTPVRRNHPC